MNPSDPAMPAFAALAARLLEPCEALPAWWRAPLRAGRGAAEALGRAPVDASRWDGAWNGFQEPFLTASAHVEALRDPAPMLSAPLAGSVATAEPAERASAIANRIPGAIGSSRGTADATPPAGPRSSGATRSPSRAEAIPSRSRGSRAGTGHPDADPGAKSAKDNLAPSPAAAGPSSSVRAALRSSAPAGSGSQRTLNTVEAGMGAWLARAQRALLRISSSPSRRPGSGADEAKAPVQHAGPDSNGAQAWFAAWIQDPSAGSAALGKAEGTAAPKTDPGPSLPGATGAAALALAPVRSVAAPPGTAKVVRPARDPAWTEILEELMPLAGSGAQAVPSGAGLPAPAFVAAPPVRRDPKDGPGAPEEVTSKGLSREEGPASGASASMESPRSKASSSVEWLDEEEDLAGKLHRLLRRQAKRRGVDLS